MAIDRITRVYIRDILSEDLAFKKHGEIHLT